MTTIDGRPRSLADYAGRPFVLQTGSSTCGPHVSTIVPMNAIAAAHPDVAFLVLYVREAHPGERRGPHRNLADKTGCARDLQREGERREILIDDLDGTLHRALGSMPNCTFVVDPSGIVEYLNIWTHPPAIRQFLDQGSAPDRGHKVSPPKPGPARRSLQRGGWLALWDQLKSAPALIRYHRRTRGKGVGSTP
ncbi:hypothetical protein F6B93_14365 [Mycobacterium spongiae]|uniref:Thioredoxin domain-containing protein n=1 Tax=Mycobacterium spongiae TaxID=886343 RepID=A0A975PXR9_9MYCO|nr:deiodinase-like protein [Mycobacterium spongiae]QUR68114.1 hypothetical protein F6B93_14365 [Mycobacterium spongiae]